MLFFYHTDVFVVLGMAVSVL